MKKLFVVTVLLVAMLFVSTVVAVMYFSVQKPASFRLLPNTYGVELYAQPVNATTIVTSITFPDRMIGDPSNPTSSSNLTYLYAITTAKNYALQWTSPDLPTGMSLMAKWNLAGESYYNWAQNTTINVDLVLPNSGQTGMRLFFVLAPISASPGNYSFSINIQSGA